MAKQRTTPPPPPPPSRQLNEDSPARPSSPRPTPKPKK